MNIQLSLNLSLRNDATFETFYAGRNIDVINSLQNMLARKGESFLYIWGDAGLGRTHLLQAACHYAVTQKMSAMYVPLKEVIEESAISVLQGLEHLSLVCLDDIDIICGKKEWEEAIFYLFNHLFEQKSCFLISGSKPIKQLTFQLPDLQSRLAWMVAYELRPFIDEEKLKTLQLRAYQMGLELNDAVGKFLLQRCSRSMHDLFTLLDELDKASLMEQRRLTVPFIKKVLRI